MTVSTLDVDRNISTLRLNSQAFSKIENILLSDMFEECIQNIKGIAYFWATLGADNKGIKDTVAEGEEWLGGLYDDLRHRNIPVCTDILEELFCPRRDPELRGRGHIDMLESDSCYSSWMYNGS